LTTELKKLVIDRSKWLRSRLGKERVDGKLLNEWGKMCCLGFDCHYLHNVPRDNLAQRHEPCTYKLPCSLNKPDQQQAIRINDRGVGFKDIAEAEQERLIAELFLKNGVEVIFEGEK